MGVIRGRIKQKEWTKSYTDGFMHGVGHLGYWTNRICIGGEWPFIQRKDGTWYDPKTGKDYKTVTLKEFLEGEPK